jgi:hypothetical protein
MRIVRPNGASCDSDISSVACLGFVDRYWALLLNGCGCATVAQWLFPAENLR